MKRWAIVAIVAVGLLAGGLLGLYLYLAAPTALVEQKDAVPLETRESNTDITGALVDVGITQLLVDVNETRAYVGYTLPPVENESAEQSEGAGYAELVQRTALLAIAAESPGTPSIVLLQYVDEAPSLLWKVETAAVLPLLSGEATWSDVMAAVEVTQYASP